MMLCLITALGSGKPEDVDRLRSTAGGCPACMLAAIIQSGIQTPPDETGPGFHVEFDFKAEKQSFWQEVNSVGLEHY
jgi:hypothetical protein